MSDAVLQARWAGSQASELSCRSRYYLHLIGKDPGPREAEYVPQGHSARKWQRPDLDQVVCLQSPDAEPPGFTEPFIQHSSLPFTSLFTSASFHPGLPPPALQPR